MKNIAIIVPCYNEEEVLKIFYDELLNHLSNEYIFKILFIDDGSKDNTINIIKELSQKDDRIKYLSFSRNFGKEAAMFAGLELAKKINSDAAIIIDADLQDPPHLIPQMLKYYQQGYKHIYAKHRTRKGEPFLKTLSAKAFYKIYAFFTNDKALVKGSRDFCLLDKRVIKAFLDIKDQTRFTKGIFSWVGFEKKCIEFDYIPRAAGKTKWSFLKLFKYAMTGMNQFSHIYMFVTTLALVLVFGFLVFDIVNGIINAFNWFAIRLNIYTLIILVVLRFIMKLAYDIRDQNLKRPMYITKETNVFED